MTADVPPVRRRPALGLRFLLVSALMLLAACSGGDDWPAAVDEEPATYDIRQSQCDGIRAAGTITNTSGADAAFEITALFTYDGRDGGLPIQTTVTAVLADGESAEFSISSDRGGAGIASSCEIIGAEIVPAGGTDGDDAAGSTAPRPDALDGGWVAVGRGGAILVSEDGETWFEADSPTDVLLLDVAYARGLWMIVGDDGTVLTSRDGVTWIAGNAGVDLRLQRIRYEDGQWQARPANSHDLLVSSDGASWTLQDDVYAPDPSAPDHTEPFTVTAAGDGRELAIGRPGTYGGQLLVREDGGVWAPAQPVIEREDAAPVATSHVSVTSFATDGEGTWVFVGGINDRQFVVSDDLDTWSAPRGDVFAMSDIAYDGAGRWIAVGDRGYIYASTDGRTWERLLSEPADDALLAVVHVP